MIKILGLGPGSPEALTLGTINILKDSSKKYFRTEKHPTIDYIKEMGAHYSTYDFAYEKFDSFDEVYNFIAEDVVEKAKNEDIIYAVPGHPLVAEKSVKLIIDKCIEKNIEYKVYPAVSFVDVMMETLAVDPVDGLKIIDAFDMNDQTLDKRCGLIITQVYDKYIASEVKLKLGEYYKDDMDIYFVRAAGVKDIESIRKIKIYEIDRQEDIDYLTSLYIPKDNSAAVDFNDLLNITSILRGPEGCPWDREQDLDSIKRYIIDECYEVIDAINDKDDDAIAEELGDLLFQIVFIADIEKEEGFFSMKNVIEGICKKMIDRHPHVFGEDSIDSTEKVLEKWDDIKKKEKEYTSYTEELRHIAKSLPALMRAEEVQKKAAKVGFDWDNVCDAMKKVDEELFELKEVYKGKEVARILEELGDLVFAIVNVARFLKVNPEEALTNTTEKFIRRFAYIEEIAVSLDKDMRHMTLEEMDELWDKAKKLGK